MSVKCLIVDDDPMTCQLLKIQLDMEGYACTTCSDPRQALAVIAAETPALVLVDFHLGAYDGLGLLHSIRKHKDFQRLPVIIMSGMDYRRECESAGANAFVLKPFGLRDLANTIEQVLKQTK